MFEKSVADIVNSSGTATQVRRRCESECCR